MTRCNVFQTMEEIASSPQAFTSRTGAADSMENVDSSRLTEGKDVAELVENGFWSKWQFQRQPAVTQNRDVQFLDDTAARWRMVAGDLPPG